MLVAERIGHDRLLTTTGGLIIVPSGSVAANPVQIGRLGRLTRSDSQLSGPLGLLGRKGAPAPQPVNEALVLLLGGDRKPCQLVADQRRHLAPNGHATGAEALGEAELATA
jgi:hypothetical protein